jgi:hypothetical protein
MKNYFTDRENGPRPRTVDGIDSRVWGGLYTLVNTRLGDHSLGFRFPYQCPDGYGPCGCDLSAMQLMLASEVGDLEWPLSSTVVPPTPVILDLLEFCAAAIGQPIEGSYHSFFRHHHLDWDHDAGLQRFVGEVNTLFARNGVALELTAEGQARRILPQPLSEALSIALFKTGDEETDRLLEAARLHIVAPRLPLRQDALEKLWDAFERIKTLEPGRDKREQADALLNRVSPPGSKFRRLLADETAALTTIGNTFRIRHSEVSQEKLASTEQIDFLFGRMFSFIRLVLKATDRGG